MTDLYIQLVNVFGNINNILEFQKTCVYVGEDLICMYDL